MFYFLKHPHDEKKHNAEERERWGKTEPLLYVGDQSVPLELPDLTGFLVNFSYCQAEKKTHKNYGQVIG